MNRLPMLLALGCCSLTAADLSGTWAGVMNDTGAQINLTLIQMGHELSGTVSAGDLAAVPIEKPVVQDDTVEFEAHVRDRPPLKFRFTLRDDLLEGQMSAENQTLNLKLARRTGMDSRTLAFQDRPAPTGPVLIYKTEPQYTEEARAARLQGTVTLKVVIDSVGHLTDDVTVLQGLGLGLDQKAVEAVKKWRWRPAYNKSGQPVATFATVMVNFRLL